MCYERYSAKRTASVIGQAYPIEPVPTSKPNTRPDKKPESGDGRNRLVSMPSELTENSTCNQCSPERKDESILFEPSPQYPRPFRCRRIIVRLFIALRTG